MEPSDAAAEAEHSESDCLRALAMVNYGHFTTMRVEGLRVRGLSLHLERLRRDCRTVFGADLEAEQVRAHLRKALADAPDPVTARVTVCDPGLGLERPGAAARPRLLVTTRAAGLAPLPPLRVRTAPHRREVPAVKHTGLFGALHQRGLAQRDGFNDVLFTQGPPDRPVVAEGPTWNVGFFGGGSLVWPAADVLPGVTTALLAEHHSGAQRTEELGVEQLSGMEAAFATNAGFGIRPIASVDGIEFDVEHPALRELRSAYESVRLEEI
ncbi:aminotransferase [Streptomyces armeniacus]|uniref:Aminotransferase n=1 Tax=Streptomyces armeniacus TaxID=83291 RepID=A0A345XQ15_9ACTN|nr:aminotransferase class IV [Streptomyces armeniacus]AXK33731.1 aminotransferase [Streptomyces armeniacus]